MRVSRLAHLAIAAIFFIQSVAAAATVAAVAQPSGSSLFSSLESKSVDTADNVPCHGDTSEVAVETIEVAHEGITIENG